MKRTSVCFGFVATLSLAIFAAASPPPPEGHDDPLGQSFFPPELVMQNQQEIGLQESQRDAIRQDVQKAQSFFLDWQWKLAGEVEKLKKLVDAAPIDEVRTLDQVDKVLAAEREIKRAQLALLMHIKNVLNDKQRQKLSELRQRSAGPPPPR